MNPYLKPKWTMTALLEEQTRIENDSKYKSPAGSFYRHTSEGRKKLDQIAWAITYKLEEKEEG